MDTSTKIALASFLHWFFKICFVALYLLSFWVEQLLLPFLLLVLIMTIAWVPLKDCPLLVWENQLRRDANLPRRNFFGFNVILQNKLRRSFGISLPNNTTLYAIGVWVAIRLVFLQR